MERIVATYFIETPSDPERAASILAGEQSSGTFVPVPGETIELKERFAARVEEVQILNEVESPSLPSEKVQLMQRYIQAVIKISWSIENFGFNLPVLISTIQGNLYELRHFTGLKLVNLSFPDSYIQHFRGPKFGIEGSRRLTGVYDRPLIGTIIKPSIGLTPQQTAGLVHTLGEAGLDFIKDDELLSSSANSPFDERVVVVMDVINRLADKTGKKIMYAFNISGEMDEMLRRYETILKAGGTCAMVSLNSVGISAAKKIADIGALAIHGHRNGWGMLARHPLLGIEFSAYQQLWRLAGIDQIHVNGIGNKFWESDESVVRSIKSCLAPMAGGYSILPVVSSGQWGGQAFETWRRTSTIDLLYMAGGGIMAHPMGAAAGVTALLQAWNAAVNGLQLHEAVAIYPEFAKSVEKFGSNK
jgi:ribulose-bisphosphate carboxylase large chain